MRRRLTGVALGAAVLVAVALVLRQCGPGIWPWPCAFRTLTGLYCPGCGMTRATFAALHGNLAAAFRFNPLGMMLMPLALAGLGLELAGWVRGKPSRWRLRGGVRAAWFLIAAALAFWILRNLPWWPCPLLAPP